MAAESLNQIAPGAPSSVTDRGDVPERIRRRYLTTEAHGAGLGFFVDATTTQAAFRDQGRRLTTDRNDPNVVRDLVAIAGHRGWTAIEVRGQTDFRREVWLAARRSGLEVKGYTPTERDQQGLARRLERTRGTVAASPETSPDLRDPGAQTRLRIVEAVVRNRVVEPGDQARILAAARDRLATWMERGASFARSDGGLVQRPERDRPR